MTGNRAEKQTKRKRGRNVSTSDLNYLQKHTDFDEEEIREWFEVFLKVIYIILMYKHAS